MASADGLIATVQQLHQNGELDSEAADRLKLKIPLMLQESGYLISHLGAHLAIGIIFAFDVIPLPLGTIARVVWVVLSRCYETLRGDWQRARIHSLAVLGVSAIPVVGYFAYLIPLRSLHPEMAVLLANHLTFQYRKCSLSQFLADQPRWIRSLVHKIVGEFPAPNSAEERPEGTTVPTQE